MRRLATVVLLALGSCVLQGQVHAGDAFIESFSPQGTVKDVRQATAHFSSDVVDFGDPRAKTDIFEINCPEKGKARWVDGKNWVYDFERDLPAGVKCTFTLKPGVASGKNEYSFSTGGPTIKRSEPYQGSESVDEDQIFALVLDGEVKEESIARNVVFNVEGLASPVGVRVITGAERKSLLKVIFQWGLPKEPVVLLQARQQFPANARVSLVWGKGVQATSGVALAQEQVYLFRTRKPFEAEFTCERENAQAACLPITAMQVRFTSNITAAAAHDFILKMPDGTKRKPDHAKKENADFVSFVEFKGPFPENAEFKLELPAGLTDDAGRKLANASKFPLKIQTASYPPLAKFSAVFGILEAKDPVLPVTLRSIEAEVPAQKIELAGTVLRSAGSLRDVRTWLKKLFTHDREKSIFSMPKLDAAKAESKTFKISKPAGARAFEVIGIPLDGPGFYVVEVQSDVLGAHLLATPKTMYVPTAVLVTNLAVHFKWGHDSSLVWVTTLDSAEPVEGAEVAVSDCKGASLWKGKTGAQGVAHIAHLPTRDEVANCSYESLDNGLFVTAARGDDFSFVHSSWDKGIESWRFQLPYESTRDNTIAHTILDRSLLRAGETVHMKHLIRRHVMQGFSALDPAKLPGAVVISHNGGDQNFEFPLKWGVGGVAETTWKIPQEAKLGTYEVILTPPASKSAKKGPKHGGYVEGFRAGTFRVEEFRVPLMRVQVLPPKIDVVGSGGFHADVSIQYLAGGAAAGLPVRVRSQVQPKLIGGVNGFEGYEFSNGPVEENTTRQSMGDASEYGEEGSASAPAGKQAPIESHDQVLDKSGSAQISISGIADLKTPKEVLAEAEFKDPNGKPWPHAYRCGRRRASWA